MTETKKEPVHEITLGELIDEAEKRQPERLLKERDNLLELYSKLQRKRHQQRKALTALQKSHVMLLHRYQSVVKRLQEAKESI